MTWQPFLYMYIHITFVWIWFHAMRMQFLGTHAHNFPSLDACVHINIHVYTIYSLLGTQTNTIIWNHYARIDVPSKGIADWYPKKKKEMGLSGKVWSTLACFADPIHGKVLIAPHNFPIPFDWIAIVTAGTTATNNNRQVINANHNQDSNRQKECCLSQAMQIAFAKLINQRIDLCLCRLSKR